MDDKKILFIVGSGRSGTTLLRNILLLSTEVAITPELHFIDAIMARRKSFGSIKNFENRKKFAEYVVKHIKNRKEKHIKKINIDEKKMIIDIAKLSSHKDVFQYLIFNVNTNRKASIIVEKTPYNIFFIKKIIKFFPNSLIINLVRDGREVCSSAMKKRWYNNYLDMVAHWNMATSIDVGKFTNNNMLLRYEDLVNNKNVIQQVYSFIGINKLIDDSELLKLKNNSSFKVNKNNGLTESSNFLNYFKEGKISRINFLMNSNLKKYNYINIHYKLTVLEKIITKIKYYLRCFKIFFYIQLIKLGYLDEYKRIKKIINKVIK